MKGFAKILIVSLLCVLMALSVCACSKKTNEENTSAATTSVQEQTTQKETTLTTVEETTGETTVADTVPEPVGSSNTQVNTPGATGESASASVEYFNDVAFVGDSVSLKLSYYAAATGELGNAQFFTAGSLGANNALWDVSDESVHPSYQGQKMLIEDCIAASGVNKVYIMLGMNDIGLYGIDDTITSYETLVQKILEKSPHVQIVVQSMTPMTSTSEILGQSLNNDNIKKYNARLSDLCAEYGWSFVDVASVMYDAEGINLNRDFCSDPDGLGVHFTEAGCEKWIEYLSTHIPA